MIKFIILLMKKYIYNNVYLKKYFDLKIVSIEYYFEIEIF